MIKCFEAANRRVETREKWLVAMVAALLFALLLIYVFNRDSLDFGPYDGKTYESLGWRTAQADHLLSEGNFNHAYWSPSWVVTIGTLYKIFGRNPLAIRVLLALCAVGSGLLVNRWTRRRGLPPLACLLAMILTVSGLLTFRSTAYCHYEIFLGFGLLVFSWLLFRGNRLLDHGGPAGYALLAVSGLLFGFISLVAPKVVVLLLVLPALQLLSGRKKHALRTSLVVLFSMLVIGGWTARNMVIFGEFIPLTSNGGINLYIANNPDATGGYMNVETGGHPLHDGAYFRQLAIAYILENPGLTALRMLKKAALFFNPHYGDQIPVILLFAVALVRFPREKGWLRDIEGLWFITMPFVFMAIHSVFHYEFRYILPVWPALAWVGAHAFTGWNAKGPGTPDPDTHHQ